MLRTSLLLLLTAVLLQPADRRMSPVLVELFTSEGCSSCPPADRLLEALDKNPDVIVLSEHVDYWNQLGWRDPYSSAAASARQQDYAQRFRLESVYTPQMVIDGRAQEVGNDRGPIQSAIAKAGAAQKTAVEIADVSRESGKVHFRVHIPQLMAHATVYIALADDRARSEVARGENRGRTLDHVAVVRKLYALGVTDIDKATSLPLGWEPKNGVRLIAFVQERGSGAILGAVRYPGLL